MKKYQPLVLQPLNIKVPMVRIHRLALHRHLPGTTAVRPHSHQAAQCLVYLSGRGLQQIGAQTFPVQAGTAVFLPPRTGHSFHRERNRSPVCLVLDFEWRGSGRKPPVVAALPVGVFREVQRHIAAVFHLQRQEPTGPALHLSAVILQLLDQVLSGLGLTRRIRAEPLSPISLKLERLLDQPESQELPLGKLARAAGYQRDYLNRILKQQTGLTLGQLRARKRAARSQQLLRQSKTVTEVAEMLGFIDANYFSRWFRKQNGMTPTQWRRNALGVPAVLQR